MAVVGDRDGVMAIGKLALEDFVARPGQFTKRREAVEKRTLLVDLVV